MKFYAYFVKLHITRYYSKFCSYAESSLILGPKNVRFTYL